MRMSPTVRQSSSGWLSNKQRQHQHQHQSTYMIAI